MPDSIERASEAGTFGRVADTVGKLLQEGYVSFRGAQHGPNLQSGAISQLDVHRLSARAPCAPALVCLS